MKVKTRYACQECGTISPQWLGKCPGCAQWNTLVEERSEGSSAKGSQLPLLNSTGGGPSQPVLLEAVQDRAEASRLSTGISELDRVLGGGLVRDGFVLIGGDPGVGKSTLLLQTAGTFIQRVPSAQVLYASGEESVQQIRDRAKRMEVKSDNRLHLLAETSLDRVLEAAAQIRPQLLIVDSLQTFSSSALESAPGSVAQVREIAARLMVTAKQSGIAVWLVGHVTKDGSIAGPKVVEHAVDTVLMFEGDPGLQYRMLRAVKNRFGTIQEVGVFEMCTEGLREVKNPSALFLSDRVSSVPGTAVAACLEGTRSILVELQALCSSSALAIPRRTSAGIESTRVSLISAIVERHLGETLAQKDLFFNVSGGMRVSDPACDLAAAAAIWSSLKGRALPHRSVFIGELALTGEVRRVSHLESRIREAERLGFTTAFIPASSGKVESTLELKRVSTIRDIVH